MAGISLPDRSYILDNHFSVDSAMVAYFTLCWPQLLIPLQLLGLFITSSIPRKDASVYQRASFCLNEWMGKVNGLRLQPWISERRC
ncbi:hypothetical protein CEXT_601161 [Caerostris extrusa]|uniref:Uncharacterized protein n=1 Tax=Caerostris extrusa TaxID=172846 RepID=A0AAV4RM85_CAEEX|nr:hypothetical protein CEXT_601161 [Caerostris extrusa]